MSEEIDKVKEAAVNIACQGIKMCIELKAERDRLERQLAAAEACLVQIAHDQIELSHEKVLQQRNDYLRWAKEAITHIEEMKP
jgi:hypothetical protein